MRSKKLTEKKFVGYLLLGESWSRSLLCNSCHCWRCSTVIGVLKGAYFSITCLYARLSINAVSCRRCDLLCVYWFRKENSWFLVSRDLMFSLFSVRSVKRYGAGYFSLAGSSNLRLPLPDTYWEAPIEGQTWIRRFGGATTFTVWLPTSILFELHRTPVLSALVQAVAVCFNKLGFLSCLWR